MIIAPFRESDHEPHAVVREEDVQLILAAEPRLPTPGETLGEIEADAMRVAGRRPGSVVVRPGRPLVLLAVIHDLDREPSWHEPWIATATRAVLQAAHWRGLTRIAMPLLGTVHGRMDPLRALDLLANALEEADGVQPQALWLENLETDLVETLRHRLCRAD